MLVDDCIRIIGWFANVNQLQKAYYNLIKGWHKGCVTNIRSEITKGVFTITLNMGVVD